jgi:predicted proteasome-type protease
MRSLSLVLLGCWAVSSGATEPPGLTKHGPLRIASSGTHLESTDGTAFFVLADTCWCGPALSSEADWKTYLADRVAQGFTAIQFNMVSPWRAAPTDAEGRIAYTLTNGQLALNEAYYQRLDARFKAINDAGLLAMPVLCWAHKKGDAGKELTEEQLIELCRRQVERYRSAHVLWILAGDNHYTTDAALWKRIGRAVFAELPSPLVTTHPTGENFPWASWEDERWLTVLGYQSGHGDSDKTLAWLTRGPVADYGRRQMFTRPCLNLEPAYEGHNGYSSRKPHTDYSVRRAMYGSLLSTPIAGITYGGHGVWSWHTKAGEEPTDHRGSGVAKIWSEAIHLPAAGQMKHLRSLFESLPWTDLRPAPNLLTTQPGTNNPAHHVTVAATPDRRCVIAYVPAVGHAGDSLRELFGDDPVMVFDPKTGTTTRLPVKEMTESLRGQPESDRIVYRRLAAQ